jgi:plastocyanin
MRTGLLRRYGKKDTVQEYIETVIKHFGLSKEVRDTALEMFNYIARNTSFRGLAPTMQAMTLVNLAAKEKHRNIPSNAWSGLASYNTLLKHSKDFEKNLKKRETKESDTTVYSTEIKKVIIPPDFTNRKLEVNYFIPRFVKVLRGQEVEWVNLDTSDHQLKLYKVLHNKVEPLLVLDTIEPKKSVRKRFDTDLPRIDYLCTKHKNEIGTIVVYSKPEEEMTSKQQYNFLSNIFDIEPPPSLSHLVSK